jgi:N-acetylneuraminate lyase
MGPRLNATDSPDMKFPLPGLVAAPFTAFHPDGSLAPQTISGQARVLADNGVIGAFICGTTGEGPSLSSEERRAVAAAWVKARPASLKVIVHAGHLSLPEAQALARHAQEIGADAIAAIAPSFFKPARVEEVVQWCAAVASAAPRLPFFYYHLPAMTHVSIKTADFLRQARDRIPTLAGIKFTHEDLDDLTATRALCGDDFEIMFGRDERLLSALKLGAHGAVGSTYNYVAPIYHRIRQALADDDLPAAERDQAKARAFIDIMNAAGGQPAGKAIMKLIGLDCGPCRLPLRTLSDDQIAQLRTELDAAGFFEFANRV